MRARARHELRYPRAELQTTRKNLNRFPEVGSLTIVCARGPTMLRLRRCLSCEVDLVHALGCFVTLVLAHGCPRLTLKRHCQVEQFVQKRASQFSNLKIKVG